MGRQDDISDIKYILDNYEIPDKDIKEMNQRLYIILDHIEKHCKDCGVEIGDEHPFDKNSGYCHKCHQEAMERATEEWKMTGEVIGRW